MTALFYMHLAVDPIQDCALETQIAIIWSFT